MNIYTHLLVIYDKNNEISKIYMRLLETNLRLQWFVYLTPSLEVIIYLKNSYISRKNAKIQHFYQFIGRMSLFWSLYTSSPIAMSILIDQWFHLSNVCGNFSKNFVKIRLENNLELQCFRIFWQILCIFCL